MLGDVDVDRPGPVAAEDARRREDILELEAREREPGAARRGPAEENVPASGPRRHRDRVLREHGAEQVEVVGIEAEVATGDGEAGLPFVDRDRGGAEDRIAGRQVDLAEVAIALAHRMRAADGDDTRSAEQGGEGAALSAQQSGDFERGAAPADDVEGAAAGIDVAGEVHLAAEEPFAGVDAVTDRGDEGAAVGEDRSADVEHGTVAAGQRDIPGIGVDQCTGLQLAEVADVDGQPAVGRRLHAAAGDEPLEHHRAFQRIDRDAVGGQAAADRDRALQVGVDEQAATDVVEAGEIDVGAGAAIDP